MCLQALQLKGARGRKSTGLREKVSRYGLARGTDSTTDPMCAVFIHHPFQYDVWRHPSVIAFLSLKLASPLFYPLCQEPCCTIPSEGTSVLCSLN